MSLSEIKKKYRQILQQSNESEDESEDEKVLSLYQQMQKRKKKILSVNKQNNQQGNMKPTKFDSEKQILLLREKLGQAILNLEKKQSQLKSQCNKKNQIFEQKRILQKQLQNYKEQIQKKDRQLIHIQSLLLNYQQKIKSCQKITNDSQIDKQILKKQIDFFLLEQSKFKQIIEQQQKQIKRQKKNNNKANKYINENQRLRQDIKRLTTLLAQQKRYKNLFRENQELNVSFLGKPLNQLDQWYSKDLISETENFLKHQKVGYGNKEFLSNVVKYINKHIKSNIQQTQKHLKTKYNSKIKQINRRNNHSLTLFEVQYLNKKSRIISNSRKISQFSYLQNSVRGATAKSKKNTQSQILDKSIMYNSKVTIDKYTTSLHKDQKFDLIQNLKQLMYQFKKGIKQLIEQPEIQKKKIIKLTEWLNQSLLELVKPRRDTLKFSILQS